MMKKQALALAVTLTISLGMFTNPTLAEISKSYDLSVTELQQLNELKTSSKVEQVSAKESVFFDGGLHQIKSGDTLFNIADNYAVTVADLKAWNNLSSDLIYVGETVAINESAAKPRSSTMAYASKVNNTGQEYTMRATAYTAYCTGCSGITANGTDIRSNPNQKVIAVDPRVIPLGTKVWVEGYGEAIAADIGGAIKGNKIDVFIPTEGQARNWGVRTVMVKILN